MTRAEAAEFWEGASVEIVYSDFRGHKGTVKEIKPRDEHYYSVVVETERGRTLSFGSPASLRLATPEWEWRI